VMARLQSGELDAASAYKIQPGPFNLPSVMPLLVIFLAVALPLPWLIHVLAQRKRHA
jgi:hypothetical protein